MTAWQNRIVGTGNEDPESLLANPQNWRIHPQAQQDALDGVLNEIGWVQQVIVNQRTGNLIDGHLRVSLAMRRHEPSIPVLYVDLDDAEESLILATLDPLVAMAATDTAKLDELLRDVNTGEAAVQAMLAELAEKNGIVPVGEDDWSDAFGGLPDGEKAPFQQMTFTVSDGQAETIREALAQAKRIGNIDGGDNENSNGNALAAICEAYLG